MATKIGNPASRMALRRLLVLRVSQNAPKKTLNFRSFDASTRLPPLFELGLGDVSLERRESSDTIFFINDNLNMEKNTTH